MALLQRQAGFSLSKLLFGTPSLSSIPQSTAPLLPAITLPTLTITLPGFLTDIWEGILKAVPKKKTSHAKRRHRQYAGKALKDVQSLNSCPGCGRTKKAHHICPFCFSDMLAGFNKVKNHLLSRKVDAFKGYTPKVTKTEVKRADKWLDIVAEAKGEDPAEYRRQLAAEEKAQEAITEEETSAAKEETERLRGAARKHEPQLSPARKAAMNSMLSSSKSKNRPTTAAQTSEVADTTPSKPRWQRRAEMRAAKATE